MRWFRSNIRLASRLALFALAVQISLCFSHIDVCDLGLASAKAASLAGGSDAAAPGKRAPIPKSDRSADGGCPICALIQLAASSAPGAAPALPLPAMLGQFRLDAADHLALAASPHSLFQARAPPSI
jgi:hypothetical protein